MFHDTSMHPQVLFAFKSKVLHSHTKCAVLLSFWSWGGGEGEKVQVVLHVLRLDYFCAISSHSPLSYSALVPFLSGLLTQDNKQCMKGMTVHYGYSSTILRNITGIVGIRACS